MHKKGGTQKLGRLTSLPDLPTLRIVERDRGLAMMEVKSRDARFMEIERKFPKITFNFVHVRAPRAPHLDFTHKLSANFVSASLQNSGTFP